MWEYRAALVRVVDADTLTINLDLGCSVRTEQNIRLLDVSAPEKSQPGGAECTAFTAGWMAGLPALRWPLVVRTSVTGAVEPTERQTFTRYLAVVCDWKQRCLNADLAVFLREHPEWGHGL